MDGARRKGERVEDAWRIRSYRDSQLGAGKAKWYDEGLWDRWAAKGLDWLVDERLPADIRRPWVAPGPRSAADFACGTGRVLEFLGRYFPMPVGIDISPDMLELAQVRCPHATLILGDVTTTPDLAPGPFDLITSFRFFLNAEPVLRSEVLTWMRDALRPGGLVIANFQLSPVSLRGTYLRLRLPAAARPPMMSIAQARRLFAAHGLTVRRVLGYSFLPYRRAARAPRAASARRAAGMGFAGARGLPPPARHFLPLAPP